MYTVYYELKDNQWNNEKSFETIDEAYDFIETIPFEWEIIDDENKLIDSNINEEE